MLSLAGSVSFFLGKMSSLALGGYDIHRSYCYIFYLLVGVFLAENNICFSAKVPFWFSSFCSVTNFLDFGFSVSFNSLLDTGLCRLHGNHYRRGPTWRLETTPPNACRGSRWKVFLIRHWFIFLCLFFLSCFSDWVSELFTTAWSKHRHLTFIVTSMDSEALPPSWQTNKLLKLPVSLVPFQIQTLLK